MSLLVCHKVGESGHQVFITALSTFSQEEINRQGRVTLLACVIEPDDQQKGNWTATRLYLELGNLLGHLLVLLPLPCPVINVSEK